VEYTAEERPVAGLEWLDGMVSLVEMLSELPEQGRVVPEWNELEVREIMYDPYRVIYEVRRAEVISRNREQSSDFV